MTEDNIISIDAARLQELRERLDNMEEDLWIQKIRILRLEEESGSGAPACIKRLRSLIG